MFAIYLYSFKMGIGSFVSGHAYGQVNPYVWKEIEGFILGEFSPGGGSKFTGKHPTGEKTE